MGMGKESGAGVGLGMGGGESNIFECLRFLSVFSRSFKTRMDLHRASTTNPRSRQLTIHTLS